MHYYPDRQSKYTQIDKIHITNSYKFGTEQTKFIMTY